MGRAGHGLTNPERGRAIRERFGDRWIHGRTGHLPAAFHIAPKLLWIRDHEPEWLRPAVLALQPRDLVALALTGEPATDGTHAAATLVYAGNFLGLSL